MKRRIIGGMIGVALLFITLSIKAQEVNIAFTTTQISGAHYAPNHIFAIWVKDANNNYVRTLMVYAKTRKAYLYTWRTNSGGDVTDAITGATVSSFKTYNVTWNLKDYKGNLVPNGTYKLCMEMTSASAQGPYREIEFTVGGNSYTSNPADGQNFKSVSVSYTGQTTGVENNFVTQDYLKIFPNPSDGKLFTDIYLVQNSETTISVFSMNNQLIVKKKLKLTEGQNQIDLSSEASILPKGTYLLLVETNHYTIGDRFIIR